MAENANTIVPLFQLRAIELHEMVINKPAAGTTPPGNFNFDIHVEANVDRAQKVVINSVQIKIKGDTYEGILGSIICACIFSVGNFEEVVTMKTETEAEINDAFAEAINSISISTTRGIMFSELKGTFLHFAFLPIIDIKAMQKNAPKATVNQ